jgi:hypothetical protein
VPADLPQQPAGEDRPADEGQPGGEDRSGGEPEWLDDAELTGLVLMPGDEPVSAGRVLLPEPAGPGGGAGGGLCWSFDVDLDAILAAAARASARGMLPGLATAGHGGAAVVSQAPGTAVSPGSQAPAQTQDPGDAGLGRTPGGADPGPSCGGASPAEVGGDTDPGQSSGDADPDQAGGVAGAGVVLLPDEGGLGLDVVAEFLPGSAGLAAWLDQRDPAEASDYDLPAVAAGWRRVAAWAQAREFAAVAQIAVRSAARNDKVGLREDGRPAAVTPDAAAQVALALALSPGTGEWWTGQAITLTWRLPGTGAALAAGRIDAYRARLIIEATGVLEEDTARRVEDDVLPEAGELTYAQLRARLRRAVIIADPEGAEERRRAAERRARVSLYPDDDGTATLTGTSLPAPHAAAAMARITALARAMKASGAGGGTDYLRAYIYLGLLLGTLPPIPPPADGGQPDGPTDDDPTPDENPPRGGSGDDPPPPEDPPRDGPGATLGDGEQHGHGQHSGPPPGGSQHPGPPRGSRPSRRDQSPSGPPPHRDQSPGSPAPRRDETDSAAAGDLRPDAPPASSPRSADKSPATTPGTPGTSPPRTRSPRARLTRDNSPRVRPTRPRARSGPPDPGPPAPRPPRPRPPGADPPGPEPPSLHLPGSDPPGSEPPGSDPPGPEPPSLHPPGSDPPGSEPPGPEPPSLHPPGSDPLGPEPPDPHPPVPAGAALGAYPGRTWALPLKDLHRADTHNHRGPGTPLTTRAHRSPVAAGGQGMSDQPAAFPASPRKDKHPGPIGLSPLGH